MTFLRPLPLAAAAVLALASATAWASAPAPEGERERAVLTYDINLGGFGIGQAELVVDLGRDGYSLDTRLSSAGFIGGFLRMTTTARSVGTWTTDGPRPLTHSSDTLWRGEARRVALSYDDPAAPPLAEVIPAPSAEDREPVPEAARTGTVDPMSGILALMGSALAGGTGPVPIYDGRRLYTLDLADLRPASVDSEAYEGPGWRGVVEYERKFGKWRGSPFRRDAGTGSAKIDIAPGEAFGLPIPVPARVQVDTFSFGGLVVMLAGVSPLPAGQTASTPCESC